MIRLIFNGYAPEGDQSCDGSGLGDSPGYAHDQGHGSGSGDGYGFGLGLGDGCGDGEGYGNGSGFPGHCLGNGEGRG